MVDTSSNRWFYCARWNAQVEDTKKPAGRQEREEDMQKRAEKVGVRPRTVYSVSRELAGEMGYSAYHLRAVLSGRRRPGAELAAKLEERGIRTRKLMPARKRWA